MAAQQIESGQSHRHRKITGREIPVEFARSRPPLRILVDGRVMRDEYHGIGRVTFELLQELCARDVRLIVLHSRDSGRLPVSELLAHPAVWPVPSYAPVASLRSQLELRRTVRRFRPDAVYIPYHLAVPWVRVGAPVVTVIHDCLSERQAAERRPTAFSVAHRMATRLAIRSSAAVLAPTQATRRDIARFYGVTLGDEAVAPNAVGAQFSAARARAGHRLAGPPGRYILHVGARRPHKNQQVLVRALAELLPSHPDLGLVLVGQHDPRVTDEAGRLIAELGVADHVWQYTRADDDLLLDLYANATVFAYPSLIEGFGLPVLEAMAAGLPVVASDADAVREAAGDGALIVPAQSAADWAKALDQVLGDPGYAAELRVRGMAVAARRTWDQTADRTLLAITRAAKRTVLSLAGSEPGEPFPVAGVLGDLLEGHHGRERHAPVVTAVDARGKNRPGQTGLKRRRDGLRDALLARVGHDRRLVHPLERGIVPEVRDCGGHRLPLAIVHDDVTAHPDQAIRVVHVKHGLVEGVPAVDEGEVEARRLLAEQVRECQLRGLGDEFEEVYLRPFEMSEAYAVPDVHLLRVDNCM